MLQYKIVRLALITFDTNGKDEASLTEYRVTYIIFGFQISKRASFSRTFYVFAI